jgi:hypothetical protein
MAVAAITALLLGAAAACDARPGAAHPGLATRAQLAPASRIEPDELAAAFTARSYSPHTRARLHVCPFPLWLRQGFESRNAPSYVAWLRGNRMVAWVMCAGNARNAHLVQTPVQTSRSRCFCNIRLHWLAQRRRWRFQADSTYPTTSSHASRPI